MLGGAQYTRATAYLHGVVAARADAGDKNLTGLEFGSQDTAADGIGCDYHPSLKTHQRWRQDDRGLAGGSSLVAVPGGPGARVAPGRIRESLTGPSRANVRNREYMRSAGLPGGC